MALSVTNIRNTGSPHWRRWLAPPSRCLVPFTSFSENDKGPDGKAVPVWFALSEERPLAFFVGVWTTWTSTGTMTEGQVTADLYGFLATDANAEVGAVHPKAMPVILTNEGAFDTWLSGPWSQAARLQRPLPDGAPRIVARGEKKDEAVP